jgi:hypothetical protein
VRTRAPAGRGHVPKGTPPLGTCPMNVPGCSRLSSIRGMPHDCRPRCLQRTRTTHRASRSPDAWHAPPPACCPCLHAPRGLSSPCVLSPDPVTTPGCPVLGECVRGGARPHCPVASRGAYPQDPLTAARRPRSARTRTAPCPAAAPGDLPLAPAHVPAASAHRPAQHPVDDAPTLEPASRHRRGRVGALRGRHTATTYQSSHRHVPRASHGTAGRA